MTKHTHTPGPWKITERVREPGVQIHVDRDWGGPVQGIYYKNSFRPHITQDRANAERIVLAVNAHDEMLAVLEAIRSRAAETGQTNATREIVRWCDAAIAKAKGGGKCAP